MGRVIGRELQLLGSHGMAAAAYPELLALVADGTLDPAAAAARGIGLDEAPARLAGLGEPGSGVGGVTVIRPDLAETGLRMQADRARGGTSGAAGGCALHAHCDCLCRPFR